MRLFIRQDATTVNLKEIDSSRSRNCSCNQNLIVPIIAYDPKLAKYSAVSAQLVANKFGANVCFLVSSLESRRLWIMNLLKINFYYSADLFRKKEETQIEMNGPCFVYITFALHICVIPTLATPELKLVHVVSIHLSYEFTFLPVNVTKNI